MWQEPEPRKGSRSARLRANNPCVIMGVLVSLACSCGDSAGMEHGAEHGSDGMTLVRGQWDGVLDMTSRDFGADCLTSGCHVQLTQTRWVHGPTAIGACSVCHVSEGAPEAHEFSPSGASQETCFSCHPSDSSREHIHDPYGNVQCLECHDPHGGDRKSLIVTPTTAELCESCHAKVVATSEHRPVADGECTSCHSAHTSQHEHLLLRKEEELCGGCHREYREFLPESFAQGTSVANVHPALLESGCRPCHNAHGGEYSPLLEQPMRDVCESCHETIFTGLSGAATVHGAFEGESACVLCHSPHASVQDHLLRDFGEGLCFRCHNEKIISSSGDEIANIQALLADAAVLHQPVAHGDCTVCHLAHFSDQRSLLRHDYPDDIYADFTDGAYGLCFQCHDQTLVENEFSTLTWFRDGDRNLHYVHVNREKGRACDICHEPHGGAQANLVRDTFPLGPGRWPMPINYESTDTGGTCTSACHEVESYDNTGLVPAPELETSPPK